MDFGGEMTFTFNGQPLVLRAKFDSEPSNVEIDGGANQDNSTFRTLKPTGYVAEPTFEDLPIGASWDAIMRGGPYNITLIEAHTGRLHTWTGGNFEGKPRVDHHTGETTGIRLRSRGYKRASA